MVWILAKSKSQNLLKSRFENWSKFKKIQNASITKKYNFLAPNAEIAFTKLSQAFTQVSIL